MNTEQERARFESWVYKHWGTTAIKKRKDGTGDYDLIFIQDMWEGWKARAKIESDLIINAD